MKKAERINNPKGQLKHSSPYGKAIGKLTKHKSKQYDSESKA